MCYVSNITIGKWRIHLFGFPFMLLLSHYFDLLLRLPSENECASCMTLITHILRNNTEGKPKQGHLRKSSLFRLHIDIIVIRSMLQRRSPIPRTRYDGVYHTPLRRFFIVDIPSVGIVPVPTRFRRRIVRHRHPLGCHGTCCRGIELGKPPQGVWCTPLYSVTCAMNAPERSKTKITYARSLKYLLAHKYTSKYTYVAYRFITTYPWVSLLMYVFVWMRSINLINNRTALVVSFNTYGVSTSFIVPSASTVVRSRRLFFRIWKMIFINKWLCLGFLGYLHLSENVLSDQRWSSCCTLSDGKHNNTYTCSNISSPTTNTAWSSA